MSSFIFKNAFSTCCIRNTHNDDVHIYEMEIVWVCLAAMAVHYKQLDAAQVAFAALRETDKILYVDAIKV